jgi:hypothetical protein
MAFITKSTDTPCYSCSKQCINTEFCSEGNRLNIDSVASTNYSLSRNIRVSITANPEFWGFSGVLISGWATYTNGYYDFFDGHDEDHRAFRDCEGTAYDGGPWVNEQRPDVFFRSVYDPDTGITKHYGSNGSLEGTGIGRGGAEVYLVDRPKGLIAAVTADTKSCPETEPYKIFKQFPENFGWGNKISFNTKIYRNMSGAWRLTSLENCYPQSSIYEPSGYLIDCSGEEKQNIAYGLNRYEKYEHTRPRASGESSYYNYVSGCRPDGAVAGKYAGYFSDGSGIYRDISGSPFIQAHLAYGSYGDPIPASGLKNGMTIGIKTDVSPEIFNNIYTIFDVNHSGTYTSVKFVGTSTGNAPLTANMPTGNFATGIGDSGHWVAFGSYDEQTCCGLSAYGVSDETKSLCNVQNYHTDFRRVFNNPKNLRQSNRDREWRYDYDLFDTIQPVSASVSGAIDRTYPSVSGVTVSGVEYFYPVIVSGDSYIVASGADPIESGHALFERVKSYYGSFFDTDRCDNIGRFDQAINKGKSRNATCYSKHATLEVFPDCVTQYDKYTSCPDPESQEIYLTNKVARLAFVYRGCDFNDNCSFDSSGLPLGAWKDQGSAPTGIEDLKRQLGGQEIHMFINLNSAWGGRPSNSPCYCDCDNQGAGAPTSAPTHAMIASPITYPHLPNFDLDPTGYGCLDPRHQISDLINKVLHHGQEDALDFFANSEYCDPLHTNPYSCLVRQPYTTYGYIMNLCGKESKDRKNVITEAFAKLHQEKTYTNANPTGDITEPMYWNVEAPTPAPVAGGGYWGSGTLERDDGVGPFVQVAGSGYGYWGVADSNGQLIAPYFVTEKEENTCNASQDCESTVEYLDYNTTGTFMNILNTINGWPTDSVPFLIEIESADDCNGCVTSKMKNQNLTLEIEGLNTEFIFDQRQAGSELTRLGRYGHNYCAYGPVSQNVAGFGKVKIDGLPFNCDTGFNAGGCGDPSYYSKFASAYEGDTCQCASGITTTLYPVIVSGTNDLIFGFTSNPSGDADGLTEISGCNDLNSSYFDVGYDEKGANGYRIYAQFDLACPSMFTFMKGAEYPDAKYEGDSLASFYAPGCSFHYPPKIGEDLQLRTTFWMIAETHVNTFMKLSEYALKRIPGMNYANGVLYPPGGQNYWGDQETNYFGLCPGDKFYTYGCKPEGTYFYGEPDDEGRYAPNYQVCIDNTICSSCPNGTGPGEVTCVCGEQVGYEGIIPRPVPLNYSFNTCDCLCKDPYLLAEYTILPGNTGYVLSNDYGNDVTQAIVYWMSHDGTPIMGNLQGSILNPVQPYMGLSLGSRDSQDWFNWNHGINGVSSGIGHELYEPYYGIEQPSSTDCEQLTIDYSTEPGNVINCEENTGCIANTDSNSRTCGVPIYMSGGIPEDSVKVRKKRCSPEIAIVTKIDCIENVGYRLYLAREYHEHDRTWKELKTYEDPENTGTYITECLPINAGSYEYNDGTSSGCFIMLYATLADIVTPVSNAPCSINPSSGVYVSQDYKYQNPGFPSGSHVWNYFNLFYSASLIPTVNYGTVSASAPFFSGEYVCSGTPEAIQNTGTVFTSTQYNTPAGFNGIFATTGTHSCVQDSITCGGELWCNKMFFPRHNYKIGTKLAPFGGSQICLDNNDISNHPAHIGYIEQTGASLLGGRTNFTIPTAIPLLNEMKTRFVDFCDDNLTQETLDYLGIDDDTVLVEDYLSLIGVVHPGWRFTSDTKSCTFGGSGCQDNIQTHTESSILAGIHAPKTWNTNSFESMGYYLDRFGVSYKNDGLVRASGVDQCLFNPFKILIDVECNTNRIARSGFPNDDPTFLQGVQEWPSRACQGIIHQPGCSCSLTQCKYATKNRPGECTLFKLSEYTASISSDSEGPCLCITDSDGKWWHSDIIDSADAAPSTRACSGCDTGPGPGDWRVMPCGDGGMAVRVTGTKSYVRKWDCKDNQYLHKHPGNFITFPSEICDCKSKVVDGLCGASVFCTDYTDCSCNPLPSGGAYEVPTPTTSGVSEWWASDCECDKIPQDDANGVGNFCSDSIVKWTVTESV